MNFFEAIQCYKTRVLRIIVLMLFLLMLTALCGCGKKQNRLIYDFDTYLCEDTEFDRNAATVLPSKEDLEDSEVVFYMFYDNGGDDEVTSDKMLRLTVQYSDEDYIKAKEKIEQHASQDKTQSSSFYYNGVLYNGFMINVEYYCGIAYHACEESKTISYIAFDTWYLQWMDVESALGLFPQFEYQSQVVHHSDE